MRNVGCEGSESTYVALARIFDGEITNIESDVTGIGWRVGERSPSCMRLAART
jgi:hypothetical protein